MYFHKSWILRVRIEHGPEAALARVAEKRRHRLTHLCGDVKCIPASPTKVQVDVWQTTMTGFRTAGLANRWSRCVVSRDNSSYHQNRKGCESLLVCSLIGANRGLGLRRPRDGTLIPQLAQPTAGPSVAPRSSRLGDVRG